MATREDAGVFAMATPRVRGRPVVTNDMLRDAYRERRRLRETGNAQVLSNAIARPNVSPLAALPNLNPRLANTPIIYDASVPAAQTQGWGNNISIRLNPLVGGRSGVLAHEFAHVGQRRSFVGQALALPFPFAGGVTFGDIAIANPFGRAVTEKPAEYLGYGRTSRTSLSQVNPLLRPAYSQILK